MNYYKRYPGDYVRDTGHLSLAEHGAYTVLLDHYYATGKPLAADLGTLQRICRATTAAERSAVAAVVEAFFPAGADGLRHNDRADREISDWQARAAVNRSVGKLGGRPKKNPHANPSETQTVSETVSERKPTENPLQNPESRKSKKKNSEQDTTAAAQPTHTNPSETQTVSETEPPEFREFRTVFPHRAGSQPWSRALKAIHARLREGSTWDEILDGARRYAVFIRATAKESTEYVMQAATFCGPDKRFLERWSLPASKAETRLAGNLSAAEEFMRRTEVA